MDEYICKNSFWQKPTVARLEEKFMELRHGGITKRLAYIDLQHIYISSRGSRVTLRLKHHRNVPVDITNRFYFSATNFEERSRQFSLFARLLCFRLTTQSEVKIFNGKPKQKIMTETGLSALMLTLLLVSGIWIDPMLLTFLWIASALIFGVIIYRAIRDWPRPVDPHHEFPTLLP